MRHLPGPIRVLLFIGVLLCADLFLWREYSLRHTGNLTMHLMDVGQGDSILLVTPSGRQVLIDGGPDLSTLQRLGDHMPFTDRSIDLLVLTHPHLDHVASLPEVVRRYDIGAILMSGPAYDNARYEELLSEVQARKIPIIIADPAKDIDFGDGVTLDVVWPRPEVFGKAFPGDINDASVVLRALYKEHSVLLTGDAELEAEEAMLFSGADLSASVLKVGHHGSKTSTSTGFLLNVQPRIAVISAGKDNKFNHPSPSTIERLQRLGIHTHVTAEEGTVTVEME